MRVPLAIIKCKCKCQNINDRQKWQSDPFYHDGSTVFPLASISSYVVGWTTYIMWECDDHRTTDNQLIETIKCIWNIIRFGGSSSVDYDKFTQFPYFYSRNASVCSFCTTKQAHRPSILFSLTLYQKAYYTNYISKRIFCWNSSKQIS